MSRNLPAHLLLRGADSCERQDARWPGLSSNYSTGLLDLNMKAIVLSAEWPRLVLMLIHYNTPHRRAELPNRTRALSTSP